MLFVLSTKAKEKVTFVLQLVKVVSTYGAVTNSHVLEENGAHLLLKSYTNVKGSRQV